ncbi:hypothetical protein B484DRAFT_483843, partial [Ochromonadaceae sp. CCMP2298]
MNINNIFAGLTGAGGAGGGAGGAGGGVGGDIPKEELMALCMKMNKRMQAMEVKGKELVKKKASLLSEREKLLQLVGVTALTRMLEERDLSYASNKDMISALQSRLIELEPELAHALERLSQSERNTHSNSVMKAEQDSLASSLRRDLKKTLDDLENTSKKVLSLEEFKVKAEGQLLKMGQLQEKGAVLQGVVEEKDSLLVRLRTEQQASERNHAMRTAMLATVQAQLEQ